MKKTILLGILLPLAFWLPAKAQTWDQVIKKVASDRATGDNFGYAVAIDGDYAIVGAYNEDHDENGNNALSEAGSAYIFERISGTWTFVQKIVASDRGTNDQFGFSVAINGDFAIIGARFEDEDATGSNTALNSGSAYIFERDQYGVWTESQKIVASDRASSDYFGSSVSITPDYAVVGAFAEDEDENNTNTLGIAGSCYIFLMDGDRDWFEIQKIVASDRGINDQFGYSLSISEEYMVIGAYGDKEDENGANSLNEAGSAYVFEKDIYGVWNEVQKIVASDRNTGDLFGESVSIDNNYIIIGARYEDEDENGNNTLSRSGSAYIFERDGSGNWNEVQKIVASDRAVDDLFGYSVSISGEFAIVGAIWEDEDNNGSNTLSVSGSVYIFERDGSGNWNEIQKIVASDRAAADIFGNSVAISGDFIIIGAMSEGHDENGSNFMSDAGSSYIFEPNCIEITTQPNNESICESSNASFSISATGTSLTYQWQEDSGSGFTNISNGGIYSGATTATLTITGASYTMDGYEYRCVVSSTCGTDTYSDEAVLTVNPATLSAGPGGVGSVDDNELWLDASYLTLSNSTAISTGANAWLDRSGNNKHATQATSSKRPVFYTSQINGLPAVDFDGSNDWVGVTAISALNTDNISWFLVGEVDVFQTGHMISSGYTSGASSASSHLWKTFTSTANYLSVARDAAGSFGSLNHGNNSGYQILSNVWDGNTDIIYSYTNGGLTDTETGVDSNPSGHQNIRLGSGSHSETQFYDGTIAEAIVYSKTLNDAERIIVDNYLGTKYNLTLSADDIYAYEATNSFEAAGIGQASNSTNHTSAKGGIVEMSNASSLDDDDFLMWAHDNGSLIANTTDVPSAYTSTSGERLPREWRVDKTNDVGTVTVAFYLDGIAIDDDLELLVDSDGTFSDATRITSGYTFDEACSIARWTGVSFSDGDYFTVGSPDGSSLLVTPIFESENIIEDEFNSENTLEVMNLITEQIEIKMYPNPTNGIITIENKIDNSLINVYNMFGQKVYSGNLINGKNNIDFSEFSNGVYIIELSDLFMNKILSTQFVLMK